MELTCAVHVPAATPASARVCQAFVLAFCALLTLVPPVLGQNPPNPVPFVHQPLVPTAVAPGGPDFTLTVNGAGFVADSVIQWNGSPRPTTFVSNTQLTAAIPASDIATIGSASVTVFNPAPGGGVSNSGLFLVTTPIPSVAFSNKQYGANDLGLAIATADFNGDGFADVAVLRDFAVSIFLGNGDGTYKPELTFPTGGSSGSTALAGMVARDFNKDGNTDLALTNYHSNADPNQGCFSVLLGNGDGTFQPAVNHAVPGFSPTAIVCGDFNNDGVLDLAVIGRGTSTGELALFIGGGDGTFPSSNANIPVPGYPYSVAAGDFNGDGAVDLVIPTIYGDGGLSVLLGNGDGTFQQNVSTSAAGISVVAADFDGDGRLDLAVGSYFDTSVTHSVLHILYGNGDGTFQTAALYARHNVYGTPVDVLAADFNGDGRLDLAVPEGASLVVRFGQGDGSFSDPPTLYFAGAGPISLAVADLNTDGRADITTGNYHAPTLSVFTQPSPVDLDPGRLLFGDQRLGTPSSSGTAILTNNLTGPLTISSIALTGANSIDFAETNECPLAPSTLAAGGSCTIAVTFDHSTLGAKEASVVIDDDALGFPQQVLNLTGTIVNPAVTLSLTNLDFGNQPIDVTSAAQTVTVTNSGVGALTIAAITTTGDFAATNNCGTTLGQGAQCAISITFNPQEAGIFFGTVTISSNAAASPQIISLKGTGIPPTLTLSATSLTFGAQEVYTTSPPQTVTLTNNGPGPLTVSSTSQTNEFVVFSNCVGTVAVSASCTISVTFHPEFNGTRTGTATIFDNAAGSPHTVSLTGTGLGPVATLSPTSLNFPNQPLGTTSPPQTVTLTNAGGATMTLSGVFATGPFEKTTTCTAILSTGASCTITVAFAPASTGAAHGSLSVNSDAPGGSPVALDGNGMDLQLALAPGAPDTATVTAGSAASFSLVLGPKGFVGTASLTCAWNGPQPLGARCTVSPAAVTLNGTDPVPLAVNIKTTARSTATPRLPEMPPGPLWPRYVAPLIAALLAFTLAWMRIRCRGTPGRTQVRVLIPVSTVILVMLLWQACGGGGTAPLTPKPAGTPAGNYTVTITVTAGEVTQTTVLGLKVN